jgi:hypothetical protein
MVESGGVVASNRDTGDKVGGTKAGGGNPGGMAPGTTFNERVLVEFEKGTGQVFIKHAEVRELVVKMEETGEAFELVSKDGRKVAHHRGKGLPRCRDGI